MENFVKLSKMVRRVALPAICLLLTTSASANDINLEPLCAPLRYDPAAICTITGFALDTVGGAYHGGSVNFDPGPGQYILQITGNQNVIYHGQQIGGTGTQILGIVSSTIHEVISNDVPPKGIGDLRDYIPSSDIETINYYFRGGVHSTFDRLRIHSTPVPEIQILGPPSAAGGVRASYTLPGELLAEGSPAFLGGFVDFSDLQVDRPLRQDFVVTRPGDGDWFDISFNGQSFWSSFGKPLETGVGYSALLNPLDFAGKSGYLLFQLHSVGSRNFEVGLLESGLVGGVATVPEISTWLMLLTGFGVTGSMARRDRRKKSLT
jgi:hypothetical protein